MSRAFALWAVETGALNVGGEGHFVAGPTIGRTPEPGEWLTLWAPFTSPQEVRCRGVLGSARGAEGAFPALLLDPILKHPECLRGAVIVEEGVRVTAYSAMLQEPRSPEWSSARFQLRDGRTHGLVWIVGRYLNTVVIGAGWRSDDFWNDLTRIHLESGAVLERRDFDPKSAMPPGFFALPTIRSYASGEEWQNLVLRSMGPVKAGPKSVYVDGDWRRAEVLQQHSGLTQVRLSVGAGSVPDAVVVPLAEVA